MEKLIHNRYIIEKRTLNGVYGLNYLVMDKIDGKR